MSTLSIAPSTRVAPSFDDQLVPRVARGLLLCVNVLVFSGAFQFLFTISASILYGFYAAIIGLVVVCIYSDPHTIRRLHTFTPYLYWLTLYALWGTLISPHGREAIPSLWRMLLRNLLILGAIAASLANKRDLTWFVRLVQLAVIVNCAIGMWEAAHPDLITSIAYATNEDATAFNVLRPGGLWSNPDEASFAFLFGFLLSFTNRGMLMWAGRLAAVYGIYLSASRTGVYILVVCTAAWAVYTLLVTRITPAHIMVGAAALAIVLATVCALLLTNGLPNVNLDDNWVVNRLLDVTEQGQSQDRYRRSNVTAAGLETVLHAPILGNGIFALQDPKQFSPIALASSKLNEIGLGTHNIYLVVWGEIGIFGLVTYLAMIGWGILRVFRARAAPKECLIALLLWMTYLLIGLVTHVQFTLAMLVFLLGITYYFPTLIGQAQQDAIGASPERLNIIQVTTKNEGTKAF